MQKIQDLFDSQKKINRKIESVVTFGAKEEDDLKKEIEEYVVTEKLHDSYEKVLEDLQDAFNNTSNEVGIWVSGFYGSGKSSFAKYLGLSFDKSLMIDGQTFGEKLMSRIHDPAITALHKAIASRNNPEIIMIDLTNKSHAGEITSVSDIVYFETLKQLKISSSEDSKVLAFLNLLHAEGKYEEFCQIVQQETGSPWARFESNDLAASATIGRFAHRLFPDIFLDEDSFSKIDLHSAMSEDTRFQRLYQLIKEKTGKENVIFVLDEVGNYIADDKNLIVNVQGMLQTFKDRFKGKVWVIATAQQTLTEDNPHAQLNSPQLFTLYARFPKAVDIEASDIKEIITKRLLGKSVEGKAYLTQLFGQNESALKLGTHLELPPRSIYNQLLTEDNFSDLYPFLPVHIDMLLALLQKLASRTGGVGLRSVIRLIQDILVQNHLADSNIGMLAGPEHFYDVLRTDMEKNAAKEIVSAAEKAIQLFQGDALAVRICKTIAVMQLLTEFNLSFPNLCALLRNKVTEQVSQAMVRDKLNEILDSTELTLQEVDGKFQFMTNAILNIREERERIMPRTQDKADVMREILADMMTPAPSVQVYGSKTVSAGVDMKEANRLTQIIQGSPLKMVVQFVAAADYSTVRGGLLTESSAAASNKTLYWLCTLGADKEAIVQDIVRSKLIRNRHTNETNEEIKQYLRGQQDNVEQKTRQLRQILVEAQANSEIIFRGTPQQVTASSYKTTALKPIAEKVFEKYPFANASMPSGCVGTLAGFTNLSTVPQAMNPFGIIKTTGPSAQIDTTHPALSEIKDFISMRNEVSGAEVIEHFGNSPYGWTKDTIRYLVALMLKAGMVKIRVSGQDITVFGPKAVEAMNTNNSFNRISIELNTETQLTVPERIKAAQNLTAIFGCGSVSPVNDEIARAANGKIGPFTQLCNRLRDLYSRLGLQGLDKINQAINYANRIKESDGGEAPFLLGKDSTCEKVFKYVVDVDKSQNQSRFLDKLSHISDLMGKTESIGSVPELDGFRTHVNNVRQMFNDYLQNPDLHQHAAEVLNLDSQLIAYIQQACIHMQTEATRMVEEKKEAIRMMPVFDQLTDTQKDRVNVQLDSITMDCQEQTVGALHNLVNDYMTLFLPGGKMERAQKQIEAFAKENSTTPVQPTEPGYPPIPPVTPSGGAASPRVNTVDAKRLMTSREEVRQFINKLSQLLETISDEDIIELNIID